MRRDLGLIDWILIAGVILALLYVAAVAVRRMAIRRPGGAVECSLRTEGDDRWRRGVAAYRTDQLYWFSSRGVCLRPNAAFDRHSLQLVARHDHEMARPPRAARQTVVVRFEAGADREPVWLALSRDALTGLLAWLEAGPRHWFKGVF
ncbi:MAG TPA: DUF2550 family protein [Streptosporangiaceae bacterium]|nr:DUF2550 family protein [Streptosporangiaceae bacterium]